VEAAVREPWDVGLEGEDPRPIASILSPKEDLLFRAVQCLALTQIKEIVDPTITSVLTISTDSKLLQKICDGYNTDPWCKKLTSISKGMPGLEFRKPECLCYVADHLVIPRVPEICEALFHLAHDMLGHFSFDKWYKSLCDAYYWLNMR
jgi:hypothetical protein